MEPSFTDCFRTSLQQSMKMIASTKLTKAQRAMTAAKAYGNANNGESDFTKRTESGWRRLAFVQARKREERYPVSR